MTRELRGVAEPQRSKELGAGNTGMVEADCSQGAHIWAVAEQADARTTHPA